MARSKTSFTGLFAHLLRPVTDAVFAETGTKLSAPQWGRILRTLAAKALRALAKWIDVQPEAAPAPIPTASPEAVPAPAVEATPEPAIPFGWASLELPTVTPTVTAEVAPAKPARKRAIKPAQKAEPKPRTMTSAARTIAPKPTPRGKASKPAKAKAKPTPKRRAKATT